MEKADVYKESFKKDSLTPEEVRGLGIAHIKICKECRNIQKVSDTEGNRMACGSKSAPYTDFVHGRKNPAQINNDGHCMYYEGRD